MRAEHVVLLPRTVRFHILKEVASRIRSLNLLSVNPTTRGPELEVFPEHVAPRQPRSSDASLGGDEANLPRGGPRFAQPHLQEQRPWELPIAKDVEAVILSHRSGNGIIIQDQNESEEE